MINLKNLIALLLLLAPLALMGQNTDCRTAIVICDDNKITFTPKFGKGIDDFQNPNNSQGCLERRENFSAWFYFELREDMPLDSGLLWFTIRDTVRFLAQDYDFAIYGPNLTCDSLGSPRRCSFAQIEFNKTIIETGMRPGEPDTTENLTGNGFIAPLEVRPKDGFYLLIDFFVGAGANFDSTRAQSFSLTWGGPAKPWLNCIANPNCDQVVVNAKPDTSICAGSSLNLSVQAQNTNGKASIKWSADVAAAASFIEQPDSAQTRIFIPPTLSGPVNFISTVSEGKCVHTDTLTVNVWPKPQPVISGDSVVCAGLTTELIVSPTFPKYQWSDGSTAPTLTVSQSSVVSVVVTDANGCTGSSSFSVRQKAIPSPFITGDTILCPGESTVLTASPGYRTYRWSNGDTTAVVRTNKGGNYTVTVTDEVGCILDRSVVVQEIKPPVPKISGINYFCAGSSTTLTALPGFVQYRWSDGNTQSSRSVNTPGLYRLTATDAFGCVNTDSIAIQEQQNPTATINGALVFCSNSTTTLSATAGFQRYAWSSGDTTQAITVSRPGTFTVTVTDNFGCRGQQTVNTDTLPSPRPEIIGPSEICEGATGDLALTGVFPSYSWSDGATQLGIRVNKTGLYSVTVTAANGCTGIASRQVTVVPNPQPKILGKLLLCPNTSNILSLDRPYQTYQWSNATSGPQASIGTPGVVKVTITDSRGCIGQDSVTLVAVPAPKPAIAGDTTICEGNNTTLVATAGFPKYRWSKGDTTDVININLAGKYVVTVTDINGCEGSAEANLTVFANPRFTIQGPRELCAGTVGRLEVPLVYRFFKWSTGDIAPEIRVDKTGEYALTVTDSNGCIGADTAMVTVFPNPVPDIQGRLLLCPNETDTLSVQAGFSLYQWSNGDTTRRALVSQAGPLDVLVTDGRGCQGRDTVVIQAVPAPQPRITGDSTICEGETSPLQATGGFVAYRWSDGSTAPSLQAISNGVYSVTVTDNNRCSGSASFDLTVFPNPPLEIAGPKRFCLGEFIRLSIPRHYASYAWSTGETDSLIQVRISGQYSVTVTTTEGCTRSDTVTVIGDVPVKPALTPGDYNLCEGDSLRLNAGDGFIAYQWSDGSAKPFLDVKSPGPYTLTVLDSNFCISSVRVNINQLDVREPTIFGPEKFCSGQSILLTSFGGPYRGYAWSNGASTSNITITKGGTYILTVTDENNCMATASKTVEEQESPQVDIAGNLIICRGDSTRLSVRSGYGFYLWTNNSEDTSIVVNRPGKFGVLVSNPNGCIASDEVEVVQSRIPFPIIEGDRFFCSSDSVALEVEAGFKSYQWTNGATINRIVVNTPGIYGLTVVDDLGCEGKAQVRVIERLSPTVEIQGPPDICPGDSATLTVNGIFPAYAWSDSTSNPQITARALGWYAVRVTADNGCTGRDSFLLASAPVPRPDITGRPYFCTNDVTAISVQPGFASYRWNTGSTDGGITVSQAGLYVVEVRNARGCTGADSMVVEQIAEPLALAGVDTTLNCIRRVVRLGGTGSSAGPGFLPRWEGPGINASNLNQQFPSVGIAGNYRFSVLDTIHGCPSPWDSVLVTDLAYTPNALVVAEDTLDCQTTAVWLNATGSDKGPAFRFLWRRLGSSLPIGTDSLRLRIDSPGTYIFQATDEATGCLGTDSLVMQLDTIAPLARISGESLLTCAKDSLVLSAPDPPTDEQWSYSWRTGNTASPPAANARWVVRSPGSYVVVVTNRRNGCFSQDSIRIGIDTIPPLVDAGLDQELDCGRPDARLQGRILEPGRIYQWRELPSRFILSRDSQLVTNVAGDYLFEVINPVNGCASTDTARVTRYANDLIDFNLVFKNESCIGRNDGLVRVGNITGGDGPYLFRLTGDDFRPDSLFNNLSPGLYRLTLQDARGCELTKRVTIEAGAAVSVDLGPDLTIRRGDWIRLIALTNIDTGTIAAYNWTKPDSLQVKTLREMRLRPLGTTEYKVTVRDTNGCAANDDILITVDKSQRIFIPNAFSPNGDGINDEFMIFSGPEVARVRYLRVFDRWGENVFEQLDFPANDPKHAWNGFHRGRLMNGGTFVYVAEIEYLDGEIELVKGDVNLIN